MPVVVIPHDHGASSLINLAIAINDLANTDGDMISTGPGKRPAGTSMTDFTDKIFTI